MRTTVVLSDVHLTANGSSAWVESVLPRVLTTLSDKAKRGGHHLEIVLAGDVLEFDVMERPEIDPTAARSEQGAAELASALVRAHPELFRTLRKILEGPKTRLVFVPGNHDAQLAFPAVRNVLTAALGQNAPVAFRSWLHATPDGILVEHGHQHDPVCAYDRMDPLETEGGLVLEDTLGAVNSRYGRHLLPSANPSATDPVAHLTGKDLVRGCLSGSKRTLGEWLRAATLVGRGAPREDWIPRVAAETGLPRQLVAAHQALVAPKLDAGGLAEAALGGARYGREVERRQRDAQRRLLALYRARAVVMGHTHGPGDWRWGGLMLGNSGAWRAPSNDPDRTVGTFAKFVSSGPRLEGGVYTVTAEGKVDKMRTRYETPAQPAAGRPVGPSAGRPAPLSRR